MSYLVLARKWRPRTFSELVGQEPVVRALRFALTEGRVHHAYLFSGIRGVGKTTVARILAKALNCEQGVSADPCGVCAACQEIDGGRFVDLIEVDAASRTKVDDTRELLDNVQYAPTRGRFKVYLIDEVHMLSAHSFNALLKTLEEPPPHVKFILATTDPQKLPVTVLSRCIKFALRRVSDQQIQGHLANILRDEGLECDPEALEPLARAAEGSVRDALSLLDQAIASGGGAVRAQAVRDMLGSVAPDIVHRIVQALAAGAGEALLSVADEAYSLGVAPESLLHELLRSLHDIAIAQVVPSASQDEWSGELGQILAADVVQLYYEIGCLGRRQLSFAPDPESGVKMTLLRMLAFRPRDEKDAPHTAPKARAPMVPARVEPGPAVGLSAKPPVSVPAEAHGEPRKAVVSAVVVKDDKGPPDARGESGARVLEQLDLTGLMKHLAMNAVLEKSADKVSVRVDPAVGNLLNKERIDMLKKALCAYYGQAVLVDVTVAPVTGTPSHLKREANEGAQRGAREALASDPGVAALTRTFNARVNENSVRPRNEK
ncbi:MAG: DNA polymerase III subunit gamma/tau [Acidiferrobacter sp.]